MLSPSFVIFLRENSGENDQVCAVPGVSPFSFVRAEGNLAFGAGGPLLHTGNNNECMRGIDGKPCAEIKEN